MKWISAKDSPPKKCIEYLVFAIGAMSGIGEDTIITNCEWDDGFDLYGYTVTHYMEMPKDPIGE